LQSRDDIKVVGKLRNLKVMFPITFRAWYKGKNNLVNLSLMSFAVWSL